MSKLIDWIGKDPIDEFSTIDVSEVDRILNELNSVLAHDYPTALHMAKEALRAYCLLTDILARLVKSIDVLSAQINNKRYKIMSEAGGEGAKVTVEMRKAAAEKDPQILQAEIQLAYLKGLKVAVEKKQNVLYAQHYMFKDIMSEQKKISNNPSFM